MKVYQNVKSCQVVSFSLYITQQRVFLSMCITICKYLTETTPLLY